MDVSTARPCSSFYNSILAVKSQVHFRHKFVIGNGRRFVLPFSCKPFFTGEKVKKFNSGSSRVWQTQELKVYQNTWGMDNDSKSSNSSMNELHSSSEDPTKFYEREKLRPMKISEANKGNTPWNKGKKLSPEIIQRIRQGLKERSKLVMKDPKVKSSKNLMEDPKEAEERENLRRMRISEANKGNTAWNKGKKHSPETRQRIRERTKLAMQDPKVKTKLTTHGRPQTEESKKKIASAIQLWHKKRREKLMLQETCYYEWRALIANAARTGLLGEEELQWDSYTILNERFTQEWLQIVEQRRKMLS